MKITIGITTFNRKKYLIKLHKSLSMSQGIETCNLRIFDDCSSEFNVLYLQKLFPNAREITRRSKNIGADHNMRQMYVDFLATHDDILVTMDADLICHPHWIHFLRDHIHRTDGIMSLYHSVLHPPTATRIINGKEFLEKEHIGSAGAVMSREVVQDIVNHLPPSHAYDWKWSAYLRKKGIKLLVSKQSYFQHIGLKGSNCNGIRTVEYGLNFDPLHKINRQFILELYQEYKKLNPKSKLDIRQFGRW